MRKDLARVHGQTSTTKSTWPQLRVGLAILARRRGEGARPDGPMHRRPCARAVCAHVPVRHASVTFTGLLLVDRLYRRRRVRRWHRRRRLVRRLEAAIQRASIDAEDPGGVGLVAAYCLEDLPHVPTLHLLH